MVEALRALLRRPARSAAEELARLEERRRANEARVRRLELEQGVTARRYPEEERR